MIPTGGPSHPWSRRACSPAYDSLTLSAGPCSGRSQTCAHPALMGGFYAPVFCWCDIRVMISDVKIIQLCWWVSPNGSYPSMASTTLGIKTHQPHYLLLSIFTDNWSRFLLLVIYSWCGSGRRNQSQSDHIKPMCVVYMGGCYWAHLSLHRLDCPCHGHGYFGRAACHAQFPGSETLRAGRDMAGVAVLHVLLLQYCTLCMSLYIYIYCSTLVRKCSECQELPLKDLSGLAFAMRFAMGCDQIAFVEFDCMTFGDLREFDTFFAADFRIIHWNFKFWKYTRISCRSLVCRNIWKPWAMGFVWMSRSFSKMRSFDHFWYRFACSFHAFIDF